MKSITIHGVDKPLAELIKSKATSEGLSVNRTIKKIFEYHVEAAVSVEPARVELRQFPLFEENLAAGMADVPKDYPTRQKRHHCHAEGGGGELSPIFIVALHDLHSFLHYYGLHNCLDADAPSPFPLPQNWGRG